MNKPHVKSLTYKLVDSKEHKYNNPPSLNIIQDTWVGILDNGILLCKMKEHFVDAVPARAEVDKYLQSWEIFASLSRNYKMIKFSFQDANIIDLEPDPISAKTRVKFAIVTDGITLGDSVEVQLTYGNYPPLPGIFRVSPDVEILMKRYEFYIEGRELLASMAYFCFTVVRGIYGDSVAAASQKLNVQKEILRTLSRLSSTRGDYTTARKFLGASKMKPLTGPERSWIEAVIKKLIIRVGEIGNTSNLPPIRMNDFPPL